MKVNIFNKSQCSTLVTLAVVGNVRAMVNFGDGEPIWRFFLYQRHTVYFIYCIRYFMVLVYVMSVIIMANTISYREIWDTLYNPGPEQPYPTRVSLQSTLRSISSRTTLNYP
jgi:hypothetical protein